MQQPMMGDTPRAIDFIGDIFEGASELPADLKKLANDLNNELIALAKGVDAEKQQTAEQVEKNLRQNKIDSYASQAAGWLQKPTNLIMAFVGVIVFIIAIRKL